LLKIEPQSSLNNGDTQLFNWEKMNLEKQVAATAVATRRRGGYSQKPSPLRTALICVHDFCFSDKTKSALKTLVVKLSIAGFSLHLGLIFLSHLLSRPPLITAIVGDSYLASISTPFSIILFYEVLTLLAVIPASTTRSITNQFEIISLIFLRDVFMDIAKTNRPGRIQGAVDVVITFPFDMSTALLMFETLHSFRVQTTCASADTEACERAPATTASLVTCRPKTRLLIICIQCSPPRS
jgi:hypothetical protein